MTLREKIAQMLHGAPPIPRLGVPAYNWWNECLHGVARAGRATVFPQAIGLAATFNVPLVGRIADTIADEAAPSITGPPAGQPRDLPRADLLVAEHQHLPRSALGPGPGNLRRMPVPDVPAGRGVREGPAGGSIPAT
jgi:hypothetical protein